MRCDARADALPTPAQLPDRALSDAMRAIYGLRNYTAFDWISARYLKGTLTLQGFVRTPQLKQQAEEAARKTRGHRRGRQSNRGAAVAPAATTTSG